MTSIIEEIEALKRENDAVLLAHYYVEDEVQAIADYFASETLVINAAYRLQ